MLELIGIVIAGIATGFFGAIFSVLARLLS